MTSWKLSYFDIFSLGMVIDGAFVYDKAPDVSAMRSALTKLEGFYPILTGLYNPETKSVDYSASASGVLQLQTVDLRRYTKTQLIGKRSLAWSLVPKFDIKSFKKGKVHPFSAALGLLSDGAILYIQASHAVMDAHCFYTLLRQWAALYKGEPIVPLIVDRSPLPAKDAFTKEETLNQIVAQNWPAIGFKKIVKMLWNFALNNSIRSTYNMQVSQEEIQKLKEQSGAGTHAVLSAIAAHKLMEKNRKIKYLKLLSVADLRGHFPGIDGSFMGTFSYPIMAQGEYSSEVEIAQTAAKMDSDFKSVFNSDHPETIVRLSFAASHYGLPYFYFDASQMNCKNPSILYVNNQLKFRPAEIDWGFGPALYAFPNGLSDMVKFWQATPNGPVSIIFSGIAGRQMAK